MSYVYIQSEPGLFTVGFYDPSGRWQAESDHGSRGEAAERVAYRMVRRLWRLEPGPRVFTAHSWLRARTILSSPSRAAVNQ